MAQQEIVDAMRYVASETADPAAREILLEQLLTAFDLIAAMPRLGRPRPKFGRDLRSHVVGSHTLFYRPHPHYVEITRVIHHRRDLSRAFAKPRRRKIKLTPEFEYAVWERVDSGEYASTDDVLSACIQALAEKESLRREIQIGVDQIERGEIVDGKAALERIRQRLRQRAAEHEEQGEENGDER